MLLQLAGTVSLPTADPEQLQCSCLHANSCLLRAADVYSKQQGCMEQCEALYVNSTQLPPGAGKTGATSISATDRSTYLHVQPGVSLLC